MKRWKIILPTLLATTSLPLVGLVGCEPKEEKLHVYFNNGDVKHGTVVGVLDREIEKGTRWCDLVLTYQVPTAIGHSGYTFIGWFRQGAETPLRDTDETVIDSNWSVTAQFAAPTTPMVVEGSYTLVSQLNKAGADTKAWQLKLGDQILAPVTWTLLEAPTNVHINEAGIISWTAFTTQGTHRFKVRGTYNGNNYDSELVSLSIGPTATNFLTDDWDIVCWWANAGIDALHAVYANNCITNTFMPNTLIGLERTIELNGQTHRVVVLDENSDYQEYNAVTGEISNPAALTFQFQNLISGGNSVQGGPGTALRMGWSVDPKEESGDYWHSLLENALNGTSGAEPVQWKELHEERFVPTEQQISVYQMIMQSEPDLALNIKSVNRNVWAYTQKSASGKPFWELSTQKTKLFCPTISNLFSPIGIAITDDLVINTEEKALCLIEGQTGQLWRQYAYYGSDDRIANYPISNEYILKPTFDFLALKDTAGSGTDIGSYFYWLGSPYLREAGQIANVSTNGCCCNYGAYTDFNGIAPCFCI